MDKGKISFKKNIPEDYNKQKPEPVTDKCLGTQQLCSHRQLFSFLLKIVISNLNPKEHGKGRYIWHWKKERGTRLL